MQMAVAEARRRPRVPAPEGLLARRALGDLRRLADRRDLAALHGNRRIADDAAAGIDGDQPGNVRDDKIDSLHLRSSLLACLLASTCSDLILRSIAKRCVSKDGDTLNCSPPFETPRFARL